MQMVLLANYAVSIAMVCANLNRYRSYQVNKLASYWVKGAYHLCYSLIVILSFGLLL